MRPTSPLFIRCRVTIILSFKPSALAGKQLLKEKSDFTLEVDGAFSHQSRVAPF